MNFENLLSTNDRGKNKLNIVDSIINQNLTVAELKILIEKLKTEEYFCANSFTPQNDKSNWTKYYISDLRFRCIQYFSEEYLYHLNDVSVYVQKKTKTKKVVKVIIFVSILFVLVGIISNHFSKKKQASISAQTIEQVSSSQTKK